LRHSQESDPDADLLKPDIDQLYPDNSIIESIESEDLVLIAIAPAMTVAADAVRPLQSSPRIFPEDDLSRATN
jgi:hypothetical protein